MSLTGAVRGMQGFAVGAEGVGDFHVTGQQQMMKQVGSITGLAGLNGRLSY